MLISYLYVRDSKYCLCELKDKSIIPYKHAVIAEVGKDFVDIILYLDGTIIGNEEMFIEIDDFAYKSLEELIEIAVTVYKYLESTYER